MPSVLDREPLDEALATKLQDARLALRVAEFTKDEEEEGDTHLRSLLAKGQLPAATTNSFARARQSTTALEETAAHLSSEMDETLQQLRKWQREKRLDMEALFARNLARLEEAYASCKTEEDSQPQEDSHKDSSNQQHVEECEGSEAGEEKPFVHTEERRSSGGGSRPTSALAHLRRLPSQSQCHSSSGQQSTSHPSTSHPDSSSHGMHSSSSSRPFSSNAHHGSGMHQGSSSTATLHHSTSTSHPDSSSIHHSRPSSSARAGLSSHQAPAPLSTDMQSRPGTSSSGSQSAANFSCGSSNSLQAQPSSRPSTSSSRPASAREHTSLPSRPGSSSSCNGSRSRAALVTASDNISSNSNATFSGGKLLPALPALQRPLPLPLPPKPHTPLLSSSSNGGPKHSSQQVQHQQQQHQYLNQQPHQQQQRHSLSRHNRASLTPLTHPCTSPQLGPHPQQQLPCELLQPQPHCHTARLLPQDTSQPELQQTPSEEQHSSQLYSPQPSSLSGHSPCTTDLHKHQGEAQSSGHSPRTTDSHTQQEGSASAPRRGQELLDQLEAELRMLDLDAAQPGSITEWHSDVGSLCARLEFLQTGYQVEGDREEGGLAAERSRHHADDLDCS